VTSPRHPASYGIASYQFGGHHVP